MTRAAQSLLKQALNLSDSDRVEMVGELLESLESSSDEGVDAAWRQEVAARIKASDAGEITPIPWEQAQSQLLASALAHHKRQPRYWHGR